MGDNAGTTEALSFERRCEARAWLMNSGIPNLDDLLDKERKKKDHEGLEPEVSLYTDAASVYSGSGIIGTVQCSYT
jgi:hypothetical protein